MKSCPQMHAGLGFKLTRRKSACSDPHVLLSLNINHIQFSINTIVLWISINYLFSNTSTCTSTKYWPPSTSWILCQRLIEGTATLYVSTGSSHISLKGKYCLCLVLREGVVKDQECMRLKDGLSLSFWNSYFFSCYFIHHDLRPFKHCSMSPRLFQKLPILYMSYSVVTVVYNISASLNNNSTNIWMVQLTS